MPSESIGTPALWVGFTLFVLVLLVLDLFVFHRKAHEVRVREAIVWTCVWIGLALLFTVGIYFWFGPERALEFLTGYLIEKALSVDNLFVFLVVFSYFSCWLAQSSRRWCARLRSLRPRVSRTRKFDRRNTRTQRKPPERGRRAGRLPPPQIGWCRWHTECCDDRGPIPAWVARRLRNKEPHKWTPAANTETFNSFRREERPA